MLCFWFADRSIAGNFCLWRCGRRSRREQDVNKCCSEQGKNKEKGQNATPESAREGATARREAHAKAQRREDIYLFVISLAFLAAGCAIEGRRGCGFIRRRSHPYPCLRRLGWLKVWGCADGAHPNPGRSSKLWQSRTTCTANSKVRTLYPTASQAPQPDPSSHFPFLILHSSAFFSLPFSFSLQPFAF